jgi:hypothetical protein
VFSGHAKVVIAESMFSYQHAAKAPKVSLETLEAFYSATMDALQEAKNDVCPFFFMLLFQTFVEY